MSKRRTTGKRSNNGGADLRPMRLVLEALERRQLLAGVDFANACPQPTLEGLSSAGTTSAQQAIPLAPFQTQQFELSAEGEATQKHYSLPENATLGTLLGPIEFVDPAVEGHYTLYSADSRFSIDGNQLYFSSGALDFETEPDISFAINAFDDASEVFATSIATISIGDVNEPPQSIELSGGKVLEHEPGAVVGKLTVVDPDAHSDYAFNLFDSRFELQGQQLKLVDGIELDFESESEVMLAVAATDGTFEIFETVRIEVLQREQTPTPTSSIALDPRTLVELTAGAKVGMASVINPKDAAYLFSVSDSRFEMRGNQLKLRDDRQVNALAEPEISLTLTATGNQGDQVTGSFTISVTGQRSPYHNHNLNEDVNGDGFVSPIDALLIINDLNINGSHPVPSGGGATGEPPAEMADVNGDGLITPMDVLLIINRLNESRRLSPPVLESSLDASLLMPADPIPLGDSSGDMSSGDIFTALSDTIVDEPATDKASTTDAAHSTSTGFATVFDLSEERRRRENASIDAELESLLDQLSREQSSS